MGVHAGAVAKAYRVLEREGLVEVRGRSGVYAAPQERWYVLLRWARVHI